MRYDLYDKPPVGVTVIGTLQWLIVTLSNTFVVPLMIGPIYGLDATQSNSLMPQTIFYAGSASLLQKWIGHRYPLMEGNVFIPWNVRLDRTNSGMVYLGDYGDIVDPAVDFLLQQFY